jgi:hypothetical protein
LIDVSRNLEAIASFWEKPMNNPSEKSATQPELPNEQLEGGELIGQELDGVTGGDGKVATRAKSENPKETVTFEYGGLAVQYTPQKPD